jgi:hypothetical protein
VVVLKDKPEDIENFNKTLNYCYDQPDVKKALVGGNIIIFPDSEFKNFNIFDSVNLNVLYGREYLEFEEVDPTLKRVCQIMDWLPERLISLSLARKSGDYRRIYGYAKSINFTFGLIESLIEDNFLKGMLDIEIRRLDGIKTDEGLYNYSGSLIDLGLQLMGSISAYFTYKNFYHIDNKLSGKSNLFLLLPNGYKFLLNPDGAVPTILDKTISVPKQFFYHWSTYAQAPGTISVELRRSLGESYMKNTRVDKHLRKLLHKRITCCSRCADFMTENNIRRGLYKFGWYLQ